jgi:pilus assembly protein CpaE
VSYDVVVAVDDQPLAAELAALLDESGELRAVDTVTTSGDALAAAGRSDVDVIVVHEGVGPMPALDLAREIGTHHPHVAVVLIVREGTAAMLAAAMEVGARGLLTLPLTLDDVHSRVATAASWSRTVRRHLTGELVDLAAAGGGTMIAVAGAKGGVGTTTVATQLALMVAADGRQRRVCLVDLDLQKGDVAGLLDVTHRRSIADLVELADDLTARSLEEALFVHSSGLRVLLAPLEGERGEYVTDRAARQILGAIRSRFDIVVVDCGATVSEASAVAVEMADRVLAVVTPDVLALRAARRLVRMWGRLQVRKEDDLAVLLNRASKRNEVQPDFARKVAGAPMASTVLPAAFRHLEVAVNSGVPEQLDDVPLRRSIRELGHELDVLAAAGPARRRRKRRGDDGQVAAEMVGVTFLVMLVMLAVVQAVLAGFTYVLASHAANEGVRRQIVGDPASAVYQAARNRLMGAWRTNFTPGDVEQGSDYVRVHLRVPGVLPGFDIDTFNVSATASAAME